MTFSDSNRILKISNKFKHDSFIVFLPKDISITYLFTAWNQETLMHVKRKCASGPFWEKMNSEIFSYLEFHTQDEKARAEVSSFRQKHVFSLFEHLNIKEWDHQGNQENIQSRKKMFLTKTPYFCPCLLILSVELKIAEDFWVHLLPKWTWSTFPFYMH